MPVNQVERAFRAWPVLVQAAETLETITYGSLAAAIGIHPRAIRYVLGVIQSYCLREKLPPLTILVVSVGDGVPGSGFIAWDADDLDAGMEQVSRYNWHGLQNPFTYASDGSTEEELADVIVKHPSRARDVYAQVKVRGTAQSVFRKALLLIYGSRCAFCGLSFEEALQAAHLIPWSEADDQQRMSPKNGLLLCAVHHHLLDCGYITITRSHEVKYCDPTGKKYIYSRADKAMTIDLHGRKALMPAKDKHWPSENALSYHYKVHGWKNTD